jgi:hypothetical protein
MLTLRTLIPMICSSVKLLRFIWFGRVKATALTEISVVWRLYYNFSLRFRRILPVGRPSSISPIAACAATLTLKR